ncbi:hypothetical protein ACIRVF_29960 [Kitasatospora sp. NPDC101157]|uniref:hypothetical protein n=1 Tax=Kitasatospora sp. NPDC101157 TaxID=3364098 RepID=UPI003800CA0F
MTGVVVVDLGDDRCSDRVGSGALQPDRGRLVHPDQLADRCDRVAAGLGVARVLVDDLVDEPLALRNGRVPDARRPAGTKCLLCREIVAPAAQDK